MAASLVHGRAVLSGALGALASVMAKLAFDSTNWIQWIPNPLIVWLIRGIFLLAMIACNAAMVATFVEGMQESGSVAGTALSTAANFLVTAVISWTVFNEKTDIFGTGLVVVGAYLLLNRTNGKDRRKSSKID